jgi:hypothetical protein
MKSILFQEITVFNLNPPSQAASPEVVRLFRQFIWLRAIHGTASFVLALLPGVGLVMIYNPSGVFRVTLLTLFVLAFTPSIAYILGIWLYNTKRYTTAQWMIYSTLLPVLLELLFLTYVFLSVFNQ